MNAEAFRSLLPEITHVNGPFWLSLRDGQLILQTCSDCGERRFPDSPVCPRCLSAQSTWTPASGRGTLWSWIVMHQKYFAAFADEVPYAVGFIQLDEGPFIISRLLGDPAALACDMVVQAVFEQVLADRTIAVFQAAS